MERGQADSDELAGDQGLHGLSAGDVLWFIQAKSIQTPRERAGKKKEGMAQILDELEAFARTRQLEIK